MLAARWLVELRRSALAAKLPLTALDKLIAFAPVAYTVFCFVAAGLIVDGVAAILAQGGPTARLPLVGEVGWAAAIWFGSLCAGLALFTPPIVVFTVEGYFAARMPELVVMGRRAVWSALTGVSSARPTAARPKRDDEDQRWKRLLG